LGDRGAVVGHRREHRRGVRKGRLRVERMGAQDVRRRGAGRAGFTLYPGCALRTDARLALDAGRALCTDPGGALRSGHSGYALRTDARFALDTGRTLSPDTSRTLWTSRPHSGGALGSDAGRTLDTGRTL